VFIADGHEDIAYNAIHYRRDPRLSVVETREIEASAPVERAGALKGMHERAMVGLPEHRRGGVGIVFATIFTEPAPQEAATEDGIVQLLYYHELARQEAGVRLIRTPGEVDALVRDWEAAPTPEARPVGLVLLMEGADPISKPSELYEWFNGGLRVIGPAWRGTRYAGGTGAPGPLTALGRSLLAEMERLRILLDVSHLAEESFWQALDRFAGPVFASHANCRAITPTDRHLSDEMIRALAARQGVIGTVLANAFLNPDARANPGMRVTLDDVVRHIDHICQLTGSAAHCALGSDFDGGFGVESTPEELDTVADLGKIAAALSHAGFAAADVDAIMGGNWLRLLRDGLPTQTQVSRQ
jgi:membrane dipeptidase